MSIKRKFKRIKERENFILTKEELEKLKKRLYVIKELSVEALKDKNFNDFQKYALEMKQIERKLKLAIKNAKKNEKNKRNNNKD